MVAFYRSMVWYENLTSGMAFVDELINLNQDLTVILVDKRAQPGGHWGLFFYKNWLTHLTQIWIICSPLWRAPSSLANHNIVSEVVNLTTAMYSNLLSYLVRVREETKLTQPFFQVNESIFLEKSNPSWFIPFCATSSTSGFLWS